jgi:hypothetical protein
MVHMWDQACYRSKFAITYKLSPRSFKNFFYHLIDFLRVYLGPCVRKRAIQNT